MFTEKALPSHQSSTSRKGFILVGTLGVVMVFVGLAFSGIWLGHYWSKFNEARRDCIGRAYGTQKQVAQYVDRLVGLNKKAQRLRLQMKVAQVQLAAAMASSNPVALRMAQKNYLKILKRQKSLDALQRVLIVKANAQYRLWQIGKGRSGTSKLHLKRQPPAGLAPVYSLKANATERHRIADKGQVPMPHFENHWTWSCAASLEKRKGKWKARLIQAKSS